VSLSAYSRFDKKLLIRVALFQFFLLCSGFLFPAKISALGPTFPDHTTSNNPDHIYAITAQAGDWCAEAGMPYQSDCTSGLGSQNTYFKLFIPSSHSGNVTVTLYRACEIIHPSSDKGNTRLSAKIRRTTTLGSPGNLVNLNGGGQERLNYSGPGCVNQGGRWNLVLNVPNDAFNTAQSDRYGENYKTALLHVSKETSGKGQKHYRVMMSTGLVSFDDAGTRGWSYDNGPVNFAMFALHDARGNSNPGWPPNGPETRYTFDFEPDCKHKEEFVNSDVFLRWSDADYLPASSPAYDNNNEKYTPSPLTQVRWSLKKPGGDINVGPPAIGGEGLATPRNVGKLSYNTIYTWEWDGVDRTNGVQFLMPFSEFHLSTCKPSRDGGIGTISCNAVRGWFYYVDNRGFKNFRARIQYRLNPGSGAWQDFPNDSGATSPVDKDFGDHPPSAGNQFRVEPQGLRDILRNRYPGSVEFKLSARDLNTGELYENVATKPRALPCSNERRATCSVSGNQVPGLPANSGNTVNVVAGRAFNLNGIFNNTGGIDLYAGPIIKSPEATNKHNYGLRFHNTSPWQWNKPEWALFAADPQGWVEAGDSRNVPIRDLMAPGNPGTYIINIEPDHFGWGTAGGFNITACPVTINVYEEYVFRPGASRDGDVENPSQINYTSTVTQISPNPNKPIPGTSYYALHRNGVEVDGPHTDGQRNYQGVSSNQRTYNLTSPPQLGDQFCAVTYMKIGGGNTASVGSEAIGYVGPGGVVIAAQDGAYSDCYRVENRPYVRAYGGDVAAGGGFENISCGRSDSKILSFLRPLSEQNPVNNKSGSGSQLAAMALGNISGFTSASMRTSDPQPPKGLTFGHDNNPPNTSSLDPLLGGGMSGNGWCVPDFFQSTQFPDGGAKDVSASTGAINVNSPPPTLAREGQTVRNISGAKLTLTSNGLYTNRHTIYVDGDVFIRDNIVYNTNYAAGTAAIPSFTLVVRGNIYIQNSVIQLDGLYIAQPRSGSPNSGRIYTCANAAGNPIVVSGEIFSSCGAPNPTNPPRLTVNGAFIAQRVILNRSGLTLRDSTFREGPSTSKAAEIFSFNPEIYLSPPVFRPNSTPTSGDYDYISVLAPTL
jgi:hypothetical protein